MQFNSEALKNLLNKDYDELEIRFKISQESILNFLKTLKNPIKTYSVMLIKNSTRRESFYDTETLKKDRHEDMIKNIHDTIVNNYAKIICASETTIANFDPKTSSAVRFKKRFSFHDFLSNSSFSSFSQGEKSDEKDGEKGEVNEKKNYCVLDITAIKNLDIKTPKLPQLINEFFSGNDFSELEMEIEFLPPFKELPDEEKINFINAVTKDVLNQMGIKDKAVNHLTDISGLLCSAKVLKHKVDTVKKITNNPKLFSKDIFETNFEPSKFMVMEKSDGYRCLLKISGTFFIEITENAQVAFGTVTGKYSVVDCEKKEGGYLAFDLIILNGEYLKIDYLKRIEALHGMKSDIFKVKEICEVNCNNMMRLSNANDIDGLIFQEIDKTYYDARILKWKPLRLITFDFLIVHLPFTGVSPFIPSVTQNGKKNMYLLMVGCPKKKNNLIKFPGFYQKLLSHHNLTLSDYNPVPFTPPIDPLTYIWESEEKYPLAVGEFAFNRNTWNLIKIREDKTVLISKRIFGNDFIVAEEQFNELHNPLTLEMLCTTPSFSSFSSFSQPLLTGNKDVKGNEKGSDKSGSGPYFENQKDMEYAKMTKYNNYVKFRVMSTIAGFERVLDIASGRGADIFIYNGLKVKHVSFVEPDGPAFIELSKRVKMLGERKFYTHTDMPKKNMQYDLTNEDYDTFASHCKSKYNALVCNFAAHYFLKNRNDYRAFNEFCKSNEIDIVILTILDSEIVDAHMTNGVYKNDKYYISSSFSRGEKGGNKEEKKGTENTYWVKHHFATELIPESKINTNELIKAMKNYELVKRDSFGVYAGDYEREKKITLNLLDLEYSSFYQYLIFRR